MPRSVGTTVENNFTGGLITEATSLNFPENAVTQISNCVLSRTGAVTRRKAIAYEENYVIEPKTTSQAVSTYLWKTVSNNGTRQIVVIQTGAVLDFYMVNAGSITSQKLNTGLVLTDAAVSGGPGPGDFECVYATGNGYLFVVNPAMKPLYVKFDVNTNTVTAFPIIIGVRDFTGLPDGMETTTRPSTLSIEHRYNLINQGWGDQQITTFFGAVGGYPSNADVWWLLKDSYGNFKPGPIEMKEAFKDKTLTIYGDVRANTVYRGNTPATRGHFILDAFALNRGFVTGVDDLSKSSGWHRPSNTAFFSGRVFYSGIVAEGFTDKIYFSQVIETEDQFSKCYQVNDPTSEVQFDLLPTDGGVISIPEAGIIYKLFPLSGNLVVFAQNGIWIISGSTGIGFSATDYSCSRISAINTVSATSFVDIEGYPAFWADEGIYTVIPSQTGSLQVQSLTEGKIKTFYNNIPNSSKHAARGTYNPVEKTIQWLYSSQDNGGAYSFDSVLVYDVAIKAFYPWDISPPPNNGRVAGVFTSYGTTIQTQQETVTTGVGPVTALDGSLVSTTKTTSLPITFSYKYLVHSAAGYTLAEIKEDSFLDWGTVGYVSSFTTGYKLRGEATREAQVNYLLVYLRKQYGDQFSVKSMWDYTTSGLSGRWSTQQIVNSGRGYMDYDTRRLKIRGHGKAVQYHFSSVGTADFNISGWASTDSVNGTI